MAAVLKIFEEYFKKIGGEVVEIRIKYDKLQPLIAGSERHLLFWQQVSEFSKKIQELTKRFDEEHNKEQNNVTECNSSEIRLTNVDENVKERVVVDPSLVQITATKTEIERRMGAFLKKKRLDVDIHNQREFCNLLNTENEFSCARVDAVFLPRVGQRSHITVTDASRENEIMKSDNITVDTILHSIPSKRQKTENNNGPLPYGIQERLENIESHLNMKVKSVHHDVYNRLKQLEEKVLYLEGLSPEYFNYKNHCRQNELRDNGNERQTKSQNWLLEAKCNESDLDERMLQLKEKLLNYDKVTS